ncbi:MAG: U32 family peptidase, partial [Deltaproteobacteria bacterium]|nr:U32 family peptidase [Deltaproteobacteria bacterium]
QASVLNHRHALIYKNMGARRIVVGRETGIREAGMIARETGLEIEMFVHGALCMSYSGNCVISNYVAGRDSNRGGCIQNCRYAYHAENMADPLYLMSSKDLNGLGHLKEFIQNKITSLKIEGRMKSSLYIATTVRAYANAVKRILKDPGSSLSDLEEELTKIPHRDYTEGSLMKPATKSSVYDHLDELNPGYEMAGTVIEIDRENNRFLMQAKNKIVSGETLEILTYNCADISLETKKMDNVLEKPIEIIHPQGLAWFPLQNGIDSPMVVRKKTIP